jgi:hypothetical protein
MKLGAHNPAFVAFVELQGEKHTFVVVGDDVSPVFKLSNGSYEVEVGEDTLRIHV